MINVSHLHAATRLSKDCSDVQVPRWHNAEKPLHPGWQLSLSLTCDLRCHSKVRLRAVSQGE